MQKKAVRILAFDISMSSPGAAIVEIKNGKARVVAVGHVKTDSKQPYAVRGKTIESWAHLFIAEHRKKGIDFVVREKYMGKFGLHPMFSAHAAIDRALFDFGLEDTEKPIAQQSVKKLIVGKGRAEKDEVEQAVRKITGYKGEFKTSDESDAVAIALACAINNGLIEPEGIGK